MRRILPLHTDAKLPRVAAGDPSALRDQRVHTFAALGRQTFAFVHWTAWPFCIGHGVLESHACVQIWMPGAGMLNARQLPDVHCELSVQGS